MLSHPPTLAHPHVRSRDLHSPESFVPDLPVGGGGGRGGPSSQEPAWRAAGGGEARCFPSFSSFGHKLATLCPLSCSRASTMDLAASRKPWFPGSAGVALVLEIHLQFNRLSSLWGKFRACIWKTSAEKKTMSWAVRQ